MSRTEQLRVRDGVRVIAPFAVAVATFGVTFGVLARDAGLGGVQAVVFSATTFAGSAADGGASGKWLEDSIRHLVGEVGSHQPGSEAMLAKFNSEHWHDEDEVRFIVEGRNEYDWSRRPGGQQMPSEPDSRHTSQVNVEDDGHGIPPAELPEIVTRISDLPWSMAGRSERIAKPLPSTPEPSALPAICRPASVGAYNGVS